MKSDTKKALLLLFVFLAVVAFVFYWRTGVEKVPGDYHVKKGNYRLEDGQFEEAIEEFTLALEQNPGNVRAHLGLAVTYMQMGSHEKALEMFNRTLELNPEMPVAYADRGILYDRMGQYEHALADYKKALKLNPELAEGPGWLWRFLHNVDEKPPTIADRASYIEAELEKPPEERLLSVPELDAGQRMYKR